MDMVPAGTLEALRRQGRLAVSVGGKRVGVFLRPDGSVAALEMTCKHQGADLTAGRFAGRTVTCPRHGWVYDLDTGACLDDPEGPTLRRHAVELREGRIFVSMSPLPRETD